MQSFKVKFAKLFQSGSMDEAWLILQSGRKDLVNPLAPLLFGPIHSLHPEDLMVMALRNRLGAVARQMNCLKRITINVFKLHTPMALNVISYLKFFSYIFVKSYHNA